MDHDCQAFEERQDSLKALAEKVPRTEIESYADDLPDDGISVFLFRTIPVPS